MCRFLWLYDNFSSREAPKSYLRHKESAKSTTEMTKSKKYLYNLLNCDIIALRKSFRDVPKISRSYYVNG
jgi:hypothetical protein